MRRRRCCRSAPCHEDFSEDTYRTLTAVDSPLVAFRGDKSAAYGLQVSLPDEPAEVMQTPSKYATYRWYGEPSRQVRELLMKQLESDPNWK